FPIPPASISLNLFAGGSTISFVALHISNLFYSVIGRPLTSWPAILILLSLVFVLPECFLLFVAGAMFPLETLAVAMVAAGALAILGRRYLRNG
ncbi:MAG TPA: hypothetical protein VMB52_04825, partial [Verrucomicrobiae bacterium]|nr:hypothetical protein [Verrucomicrobiae bacterium]